MIANINMFDSKSYNTQYWYRNTNHIRYQPNRIKRDSVSMININPNNKVYYRERIKNHFHLKRFRRKSEQYDDQFYKLLKKHNKHNIYNMIQSNTSYYMDIEIEHDSDILSNIYYYFKRYYIFDIKNNVLFSMKFAIFLFGKQYVIDTYCKQWINYLDDVYYNDENDENNMNILEYLHNETNRIKNIFYINNNNKSYILLKIGIPGHSICAIVNNKQKQIEIFNSGGSKYADINSKYGYFTRSYKKKRYKRYYYVNGKRERTGDNYYNDIFDEMFEKIFKNYHIIHVCDVNLQICKQDIHCHLWVYYYFYTRIFESKDIWKTIHHLKYTVSNTKRIFFIEKFEQFLLSL